MNHDQAALQAQTVRGIAGLLARSVRHVFIAPGSRSTPLVQALAELEGPGLQLHAVLDERAAAFAALGAARRGQLAAAVCTSGSAVGHFLPACIEAKESGLCIAVVSADRPVNVRGRGAPQAIWQPDILGSYARCADIDAAQPCDWPALASFFGQCQADGVPAHCNVALDVPLALAAGNPPELPQAAIWPRKCQHPHPIAPPQPGERVAVIAGPQNAPAAAGLAGKWAAGAVLLGESTANLGPLGRARPRFFDAYLRDAAVRQRLLPDRLVLTGQWPASKGLQLLLELAAERGTAVDVQVGSKLVDPLRQARQWSDWPGEAAFAEWADAPAADWQAGDWGAAERAAAAAWQQLRQDPAFNRCEWGLLAQASRHGDRFVVANSLAVRDIDVPAGALGDGQVSAARGANGIDGTLAQAFGEALATGKQTLCILGDAALLHDATSLQLLRQAPHLRALVIDNGGGGIFDFLPARQQVGAALHERFFTVPHGLDLAAISRAFGVPAATVDDAAQLAAVWKGNGGPQLAVARVDRGQSEALRRRWHAQAAQAARKALQLEKL